MFKQHKTQYSFKWIGKMTEVPKEQWEAFAQPLKTPFFEWDWLNLMETSGSATGRAGWLPQHLTAWRDGKLIAAAPLYIKSHSYGEFVFDHQWADVAYRLGVEYIRSCWGCRRLLPPKDIGF